MGAHFVTLFICMGFSSLISYRLAPKFVAVRLGYLKLFAVVALASLVFCVALLFFVNFFGKVQLSEQNQNLRYYIFASWAVMTWLSFLLVPFMILVSGWLFYQARLTSETIE